MYFRLILYVLIIFLLSCSGKQHSQLVKKGEADVSDVNFKLDGKQLLDGNWGVVSGKLITEISKKTTEQALYLDFKHNWDEHPAGTIQNGKGYASYFLNLTVNGDQQLAVKMPLANTAVKLIVNGKEYFEAGKVGTTKASTEPFYKQEIVSLPDPEDNQYQIIMQVSNFHYRNGGFSSYPQIGDSKMMLENEQHVTYFTFVLVGAFLSTALFLITLFFFRPRERAMLFIGVFFIILIHRMISVGDMLIAEFADLSYKFYIKSDYLTFYLAAVTFLLFVNTFFKGRLQLPFCNVVKMVLIGASLTVIFLPASVFSYLAIPMQLFILLYSFVVFYKLGLLARKDFSARLFLIAVLTLYMTVINDILYYNGVLNTTLMVQYGTIALVISLPFLLPVYFSFLFKKVEALSEKLVQQNSELKKVNSELDAFVYNVSHDLKAPLSSIQGLINIVKREKDPDKIKEVTAYQEKSVNKLMNFINDLLNYSRNTRMQVKVEEIELEQLVHETVDEIKYKDEYKSINHKVICAVEVPFYSDKSRVKIVLNNLISNAFKYRDADKHEQYVKISVSVDQNSAVLSFEDNGVGISTTYQDKVFDMFFRAHDTQFEGTGLGLYLVKECVETLGGTLQLHSEEYKGTTIKVIIPNSKKVI